MSVKFESNKREILNQLSINIDSALIAMGQAGVELTQMQMLTGYPTQIYDTGDLMRDVNYKVNVSSQSVQIGNSLFYAGWVHERTKRFVGRPYITDMISQNRETLQEVAAEQLKNGF